MEESQLKEPYNPTDPVVIFDPEFAKSNIIAGSDKTGFDKNYG